MFNIQSTLTSVGGGQCVSILLNFNLSNGTALKRVGAVG